MTQHELVDQEPLVSEAATVLEKTAQDRRRGEEVRSAVRRVLGDYGRTEWEDSVLDDGDVDWDRLWDHVHAHATGGKLERTLRKLQEREERAYPSLVTVEFEPDDAMDYVPGEYVTVHYKDVPRAYSVASSPNREHVEICVRRVPGGRMTSLLCDDLAAGERIHVRGPFSGSFVGGEFLLREPSRRDVAFLATGTGVAPFKGMIDYAFEAGYDEFRGEPRDVWLFLGASWEDDLPYHEQFSALADERPNFHYVPTSSRESLLTDWTGETAYVQGTFAKYLDPAALGDVTLSDDVRGALGEERRYEVDASIDPSQVEIYACGINAMVYEIVSVAEAVGVPAANIRGEGYG